MISIVIPIYNAEKHLRECIESVLEQDYTEFELILVNDGSKDSSLEICKEYEQKDNRIRVLSKENGGVSSARNLGIDNATGDYITFVDSDDLLSKGALSTMLRATESAAADIGVFSMSYFSKASYKELKHENTIISDKEQYKHHYKSIDACLGFNSACAKLFKLDLIKNNNIRFNEKISILEDGSFVLLCLEKSNITLFDSSVTYNYRQNEEASLVDSFHINYLYALEYELSCAKWLICMLDAECKALFYAKRFARLDGFIIKLSRNTELRRDEKIAYLKTILSSNSVIEILNNQSKKCLNRKKKFKRLLYKNKLVRLVLKASSKK